MRLEDQLLSEIVRYRTYSKFIPELQRKETFEETINRSHMMDLEKFPHIAKDLTKAYSKVHDLEIMPSMRGLQFAGKGVLANQARRYNCCFLHMDSVDGFAETMFLLLSGCGVGFSVQKRHVSKLPKVVGYNEECKFTVADTIAGWSEALDMLMRAYFYGRTRPVFDFSRIRPKGSRLYTTGAIAPGPEPLKHALVEVEKILRNARGRHLRPIEVHDMVCIFSEAVLAGGVRRSALISLFDKDDNEMLTCKTGSWWLKAPWRARANNSVVLLRGAVSKEEFSALFKICKESNAGEPGFFWTNDLDWGTNPCAEVSLQSNQFCNLTTINTTTVSNKKEFLSRVYSAALLGTVQAAFTDFPFLREIWKKTTEDEALLGVSLTGIADQGEIPDDWIEEGARLTVEVNEKYAAKLKIKKAARTTVIKPEGNSSATLACSSGIHDRHDKFYLRRVRMNKDEALSKFLAEHIPELVEPDKMAASDIVITIPQMSPEGSIIRSESNALSLLKRVIKYNKLWIAGGHSSGANHNNVSCTINVKPEEWDDVEKFMWDNREHYTAISLLPYDGGTYVQAPFESCTEERYKEVLKHVKELDFSQIVEVDAFDNFGEQAACAGGACEIRRL